jgi:hypothetical protein
MAKSEKKHLINNLSEHYFTSSMTKFKKHHFRSNILFSRENLLDKSGRIELQNVSKSLNRKSK